MADPDHAVQAASSSWRRLQCRFHGWVLDRCVLRPSRHRLDPVQQVRCLLALPDRPSLECFVHLDPRFAPADAASDRRVDVLPRESWTLERFQRVPRPNVLLLKFPGTAGRAERSTAMPADLIHQVQARSASLPSEWRTEVWTWNPPGYGGSSGRALLAGLIPAAEAFVDQVIAQRADRDGIVWLVGNSLGCLPALSVARQADRWPVQSTGLWLRNPPDLPSVLVRVAQTWRAGRWMKRVAAVLPETLRAVDVAGDCTVPAVFLMSQHDTLVPPAVQARIHDAYGGPKRIVTLTGLDHDGLLEEQHLASVQDACAWLLSQTTTSPPDGR